MTAFNLRTIFIISCISFLSTVAIAGNVPFTTDDLDLVVPINSSANYLDVLNNDDSGIDNDDFKEVIAVCDSTSTDEDCTGTSFSDANGSININGAGDNNNVLYSSNLNVTGEFNFKYIMQNSSMITGSALGKVTMPYFEVNTLSDNSSNGCDDIECTLREAIAAAQSDPAASIIQFKRDMNGTIVLTSELTIDDIELSIIGTGPQNISVSGNDLFRIFNTSSSTETISLSGFTISNGFNSNDGAGIYVDGSRDMLFENLRIINNETSSRGGGIYLSLASGTIRNVEFSNNHAGLTGGGIGISGSFGSDVIIENVTLSGNSSNQKGAGLYINAGNGQNITLRHVTSAFNDAGDASQTANHFESTGNINIESSLFANSTLDLNLLATNNVVNNTIIQTYAGASLSGDNNLTSTIDLQLLPLAVINDSGLAVHAIPPTSLAYNHVDDSFGKMGCGNIVANDQIGTPRPVDTDCDAGAYEYIFIDLIFASNFD